MATKTAKGLVSYVKTKIGNPYLYGFKQNYAWNRTCTKDNYNNLKKTYGSMVWNSDVKCVGKHPCDCSGLISAYTGILRGSSEYKSTATKVLPIKDIKKAVPGCALWMQGHIGVYIGNGYYIAKDGSAYGCRKAKISANGWTHILWLKDIDYSATTKKKNTKVKKKNTSTKTSKNTKKETKKVSYYKKYVGRSLSFSDALLVIGVKNGYTNRVKIAKANGIKLYAGTAKQNTKLLGLLKAGKLIKA